MIPWAIYFCIRAVACHIVGPVSMHGASTQPQLYATLEKCRAALLTEYKGARTARGARPRLDSEGRYKLGGGKWYVCMIHRADTFKAERFGR